MLKDGIKVLAGEVVDGTFMNVAALRRFLTEQIARAKADDVLFSVHLKATMMKVSDPIIFGHVVQAFFPTLFEQYGEQLAAAGISPNDGLGALLDAVGSLPEGDAIKAAVAAGLADGPAMAMVDSDKGITNLHVPSDVIIDASMPAMIRTGGHMWGPDGDEADTLAVIPDSSYAGVYQTVIDDCRAHGALRPGDDGLGAQRRPDGPGGRGVRLPRQDLRGRRPPAPSRSSTRPATCSSSTTSSPATSGAPARPRTPRSATGSSSPSPAPAPPARRRSSGSTRPAPTTPT